MRESVGSTWIFGLVITFIFLFTGFLTLTLNYSKAYKMKNEILTIIEKYEGVTSDSHLIINNYLSYNGYRTTGKCPDGYYGENDLTNVGTMDEESSNQSYYYCVAKVDNGDYVYYNIKIFYKFNLPFLGEITTFSVSGTTKNIIKYDNAII